METVVTVIFLAALLVVGIIYLRFCKRISEELIKTVKFREKTEKEGGDNWPNLQLEMGDFDGSDDLTYADFEKENIRIKSKEDKFCNQK
ncbi:MAG: hypothetical protein KAV87_40800 [Desulfobacteraceae bacterium]|nr:hypothetical protein [Desulfobacteraceae bacterium]